MVLKEQPIQAVVMMMVVKRKTRMRLLAYMRISGIPLTFA